jgi:hypothetical protein
MIWLHFGWCNKFAGQASYQYDGLQTKGILLEHFTMELCQESASNLLEKCLDSKLRLFGSI